MRIGVKMCKLFRVMSPVKLVISVVSKTAQIYVSGWFCPLFSLLYKFINFLKKEAEYENTCNVTKYVVYIARLYNRSHKLFYIVLRDLQSTAIDI
jgi:uncharacterized membrane protein (GlpM family)